MKKKFLLITFFLMSKILFAQEKTISGTVYDSTGETLPSVTVLIKGTYSGTETDFDGKYTINVKEGDVLVFSFIGMKPQEKTVGNQDVIDVTFIDEEFFLDEVEVVATGYDRTKRQAFTGSATTLKSEDIKIEGIVDISRMLEGRAAGVTVQNVSGTFGAAPKLTIRGSSSVFGNNTPLYVIDGVVQEDIVESSFNQLVSGDSRNLISSSIAGINANDIKSIDILKDAAATSLYGARARNGVVVIVTKSGKKQSNLNVTYNFEQTVRDIPTYANFDVLNSKESMGILRELEAKGYLELPDVMQSRYGGVYSIMAQRINTYDPTTGSYLLENTPEARSRFLQQYELANTDWFSTLFRKSLTQNHTLGFSGGGEKNAFYASVGFFTDPGWSIAENVKRLTANIKNTFYFSDRFNATLISAVSVRKQKAPGTFSRRRNSVDGEISRDFDINPFSYALNTSRTLRPRDSQGNLEYYRNNWASFNILEEINNNYIDLNMRDIRFQLDASYKLTDNLTYDFNGATRYVNGVREHQVRENSNIVKAYNADETTVVRENNIFLYQDPNNPNALPIPVLPEGGIYFKNDDYLTSHYVRNSFKYNNTFNDAHTLDFLIGQELRYIDRESVNFSGYGLQYDRGLTPFTDPRIIEKLIAGGSNYYGISKSRERTVAFFGKASYNYNNKYILSVTGRYDGSNKQGRTANSRWLPTGTISGKWNIGKENFLQDSNSISDLQLRASYGLVATPGSATNSLAIYRDAVTDRFFPGDRENFINIVDLQNSELTWEKQYELNIGIDLGLFRNRVFLTADVYQRDIFDNIDFVRTSGIGGEFVKQGNNADVETRGFEIGIDTKNIVTDNFTWSSNINFSKFNQKITNLANTPSVFNLVDETGGNVVGYPINSLFSFNFDGLNDQGFPTFVLPSGADPVEGPNFQDDDADITNYLVYHGSVDPNMAFGFSNTFTYKNWSLSTLITGSGGNKIRLNPVYDNTYSDLDVFSKDFANRWILAGDEALTNIPVIPSVAQNRLYNLDVAYSAYNYSNARVADGDFIRMKNIALGYNFDKDLIEKFGLSKFKVTLQGTNLFLIHSDSRLNGQDPEFYSAGGVAMPIRRQFTMSLNVGI